MLAVPRDFNTKVNFELDQTGLSELPQDENLPRLFRDPVALKVLENLAACLRQTGYNMDQPRPGKACPAFCSYRMKDRKINIILVINQRSSSSLKCAVSTFYSQPYMYRLIRRNLLESAQFMDVWRKFCADIERCLRETLAARSFEWSGLNIPSPHTLRIY